MTMKRKEITTEETLGELLEKRASEFPDVDAVVFVDRDYRMTWKEFNDSVDTIAKGLMALGVEKGDKLALWATNVPHWVSLQFATAKIGAILLTINTNYRSTEIDYILKQSETEHLMMIDGHRDTDYVATIYELMPELKILPRETFHTNRYPRLKSVMFLGPEKHRGMYSMTEILSLSCQISDEEYEERKKNVSCYDVVNMQYTSGTTGFPKGVMLTHFNIANDGFWIGENMNYSEKDRICLPVPLFHCFGCVLGVMASVNHGSTMVILEQYDPVVAMTAIEQ
ncbi:MAG: AMP-binding protein, partial [Methanomassiliicoccaceae archaeon]|nr:AMP-binding protein [Methanomassiliicoccaceae archaeon]